MANSICHDCPKVVGWTNPRSGEATCRTSSSRLASLWLFAGILALIVAVGTASALTLSVETKLIVGVALFVTTLLASVAALDYLFITGR